MASRGLRCVHGVRSDTPPIVLPPAADVPASGRLSGEPFGSVSLTLHGLEAPPGLAAGLARAEHRAVAQRRLATAQAALPVWPSLTDPCEAIDVALSHQPHDAYFRVVRTRADAPSAYASGLLQALSIWLSEIDDGPPTDDALMLGSALCGLWHAAVSGEPVAEGLEPQRKAHPDAGPTQCRTEAAAVRRWLRAHQIFAALTQGLVWTLHRLAAALQADDAARSRAWMRSIAALYDASAAAFRFASDFDPAHYRDTIRPSMEAPYAPAGFSGAMSVDHGQLVARLAAMRPQMAVAGLRFPEESAALKQALTRLYDDHKRVCARMAGEVSPSLRSAQMAAQPPASEILHRFFQRRLTMLEGKPAAQPAPQTSLA